MEEVLIQQLESDIWWLQAKCGEGGDLKFKVRPWTVEKAGDPTKNSDQRSWNTEYLVNLRDSKTFYLEYWFGQAEAKFVTPNWKDSIAAKT
jgi:hypothetical protein